MQALPDPQTQPAPAAPMPTPVPTSVTIVGADGVSQTLALPTTRAEINAIRARRSELSDQLTSAVGRRRRLAEELRKETDAPSRVGLEGRLKVIDERIVQLETDIASTGRQVSSAPAGLLETTESPTMPGDIPDNVAALTGAFTFFVLFPIALAFARNLWKRGSAVRHEALSQEASQRLERLEQGVEAIAIEIERVSEGQRFVTRLLSEGQPGLPLAQRKAQPIGSGVDESA